MNSKILEVSENSLLKAEQYISDGNYGRAFAHYLVYLELRPNERENIESDFIDVLVQLVDHLKSSENFENIYNCIQNALQYYPNNYTILTFMARHFLELNEHESALNYLTQVLHIKQNYLPAIKLVNYIKNVSMDRWHIRMLNDTVRNQAFKQAIEKKLANGFNNVLDIGTGTGLFSMFAAKSKYPTVRITACDYSTVMINLAKDILAANSCSNVNLIPKKSTDIQISDLYPQKANLIVAEIFDSGVFGEDVIPTLIHAWENLILPFPEGQIIPCSVELHIFGVQCGELARRHRVFSHEIKDLCFEAINIVNMDNKPYDTEDFFCFKEYKYIAKPFEPWIVNFTDVVQLKKLLNGDIFNMKLAHCCNGEIDAFLLWFKLNLDDEISIDNRPDESNRNCCWEQAIFHLDEPITISCADPIPISVVYKQGLFEIMINYNNRSELNQYNVHGSIVRYLNDSKCLETISKIVDDLNKKITTNLINILDMAPFPYLGLLLLKRRNGSLKCCVKNDDEKRLILKICSNNNINTNSISFIDGSPLEYKNEKFDVIFVNVLETEGELNQDMMLHVPILCRMLTLNGILLPSYITLYGTLVQSDWFKRVSQVDDRNVLNFRIAEFIKKYETDEELDFTLRHLTYVELTQPYPLTKIDLDKSIMDEICRDINISICETGNLNAICYWFEIDYMGYKHNTGPKNEYACINNAAFLQKPEVLLNKGDQVTIRITNYSGLLKISLVNANI